jgi:hypothetical protein
MKIGIGALAVAFLVADSVEKSSALQSSAFAPATRSFARPARTNNFSLRPLSLSKASSVVKNQISMSYSVGIVGATGAVGKEIRSCLETRNFPVDKLRIFGSERSAGKQIETAYGSVTVELFSQEAARECDVCFLAVNGDFSLEHAEALTKGDGCVVIDNSVSFM